MTDLAHLLCSGAVLLGGEELALHCILVQVAPFALLALVDCTRHFVPLCGKAIAAGFLGEKVARSHWHTVYGERQVTPVYCPELGGNLLPYLVQLLGRLAHMATANKSVPHQQRSGW